MPKTAKELAIGIVKWLELDPDMKCEIVEKKDGSIDINLASEGEEFFIQDFAESGMNIKQIGSCKHDGRTENIFEVNGDLFGENAKAIAIWVIGDTF
jgi:hypothetical protein